MSDETIDQQPTESNSIIQAYENRHSSSFPKGAEGEVAENGDGRPRSLAELADNLNDKSEKEREKRQGRQPRVSLMDAYNGVVPDEEDFIGDDGLPDALREYSPEDVQVAMISLGLNESDIEDPRWVDQIAAKLEEWGAERAEEEGESEDESEGEEEAIDEDEESAEQEQEAEQEAEKQEPKAPLPSKISELTSEQIKDVHDHLSGVIDRAEQTTSPVYTEIFASSLNKALELPDETIPQMTEAVRVLQMGAQSLMETAVPQLVHGYLAQMFPSYLESTAPGLSESFREAQADNIWTETIESDDFKGLSLPKFGTPEFAEAAERVHKQNPWLVEWDNPNVPALEALKQKAVITARLLAGERISPKQVLERVAEAYSKGKSEAERGVRRVSASRSLGRGKTTASLAESRKGNSIMDAYNAKHRSFEDL